MHPGNVKRQSGNSHNSTNSELSGVLDDMDQYLEEALDEDDEGEFDTPVSFCPKCLHNFRFGRMTVWSLIIVEINLFYCENTNPICCSSSIYICHTVFKLTYFVSEEIVDVFQ